MHSIAGKITNMEVGFITDEEKPIDKNDKIMIYKEMLEKDIIHISCHGLFEEEKDVNNLDSVILELSKKCKITAKEIFDTNFDLNGALVFKCMFKW